MGSLILQPFIEPPLFYLIRNIVGNGIQQLNGVMVGMLGLSIPIYPLKVDSSSKGTAKRLLVFLAVRYRYSLG